MFVFYLTCNKMKTAISNANFRSVTLIFFRREMEPRGKDGWRKGEREGGEMSRPREMRRERSSLNEDIQVVSGGPPVARALSLVTML